MFFETLSPQEQQHWLLLDTYMNNAKSELNAVLLSESTLSSFLDIFRI